MTNPLYAYDHSGGCRSITGGAFVPNGAWGPAYDGNYLYSDYVCGRIFRLQRSGSSWTPTPLVTGLGTSSAVHLAFGPGPIGPALYYTSYAGGGEVRRLYTAGSGGNGAPTARLTSSAIAGALPLTVRFDASGSSDPEGRALTYLWNFGDGTTAETAGPRTSHVYRRAGNFVATVAVRDDRGLVSAPERITIFAGNELPRVSIDSDTGGAYEFGERVRLTASARDPEDGAIPGSRISWTVVVEHDQHTHPFLGPVAGASVSLRAPRPEDPSALRTSSLRVSVSATDRRGLTATEVLRLQPIRRLASLRAKLRPTVIRASGLPERLRGRRRARGGELSVRLSGAAKLTLSRERRAAGRVVARRCRAITRRNRDGRPCVRWASIRGSHAVSLPRGGSRLSFGGRLRAQERVARGRYRLVLRARDRYGRRSPVARVAYRVR
jgi:PKD repeat protein